MAPGVRAGLGVRAGIDIGGTFTDSASATKEGRGVFRKHLSTPDDYGRAVLDGLLAAADDLGVDAGDTAEVIHATTVATNAILQHAGAPCAPITTEGFRDELEFGRQRVPRLYDIFQDKRPALIPRRRVFEVRERMDDGGKVIAPLERAPDTVAGDVADGKLSSECARERYLVAVDASGTVDAEATKALRADKNPG